MTDQEAINYLLDPLSLPHDMDIMDKLNWHEDAVNMAIEALKAQELKNVPDTNVGDMISRQAAIDALAKFVPYAICDESTESYANGLTDAYNLILQLPSAQPEQKTGKWILADAYAGKRYRCSECLSFALKTDDGQENLSDYCPVCGAEMGEGGQE